MLRLLLFLLCSAWLSLSAGPQPTSGPGGSNYAHSAVSFTKFGTTINDCYWIYEPVGPKPDSAVVVVFWHGTSAINTIDSIPAPLRLFAEHICKKGYTVVYPLYQYGGQTLPFAQQLINAANVIKMALNNLDTGAGRVRPVKNAQGEPVLGATGISRGGGMTLNAANFHDTLGLPQFKALCAIVPGGGQSMPGIDSSTKVIVLNGQDNELNYAESGQAFDSLYHIPCSNKHLVVINSDHNGQPDLIAEHDFAGSGKDPNDSTKLNELDFYGAWKFAVGIFDCAFKNQSCNYCLGSDTLVTYMGTRSNGIAIIPATIADTCLSAPVSAPAITVSTPISIYPNPATNSFAIKEMPGYFDIIIYDLAGRPVNQQAQIQSNEQINCAGLPNGYYIVRLVTASGLTMQGNIAILQTQLK